jgi:hypothetical protein
LPVQRVREFFTIPAALGNDLDKTALIKRRIGASGFESVLRGIARQRCGQLDSLSHFFRCKTKVIANCRYLEP